VTSVASMSITTASTDRPAARDGGSA